MRRALLSFACVTLLSAPVAAQPRPSRAALAEARRRFERGIGLHDRGDDAGAVAELRVAWALSHRPSVLYNLGVALQGLRRDDEALETFRAVLALDRGVSAALRRDTREAIATLEASLAHVSVELTPANAALQLDGRDVTPSSDLTLLAGEHRAEAHLDGHRDARETFTLAPGEHRALRLTLERIAAPPPLTTVTEGALSLEGAPAAATWTVDDTARPLGETVSLARGVHRVRVESSGFAPWEGTVPVTDRVHLHVSLAPLPDLSARRWAWVSFGVAGACALGAVVTGALAVETHDTFLTRTRDAPDVDALAARGRALSTSADVLGTVAVAGVVTGVAVLVWVATRPQGSSAATTRASLDGPSLRF